MTDYNNDPALVASHAELVEALDDLKHQARFALRGVDRETEESVCFDQSDTSLRNAEKLTCKNSASDELPWVSVDERLPEILACHPGRTIDVVLWIDELGENKPYITIGFFYYKDKRWCHSDSLDYLDPEDTPTHWLPIAPPCVQNAHAEKPSGNDGETS